MNRGKQPGTAPPIRDVSDQELRENTPLVHFTIKRMQGRGQLLPSIEYDDHFQNGMLGLWEALRRWEPSKGALSTYCSSYIWGYLLTEQAKATKADGWSRTTGERIATVVSYEQEISEDFTLRETLAAPDDTEDAAHWSGQVARLVEVVDEMREPIATVARLLFFEEAPQTEIARVIGVSRGRVNQLVLQLRAEIPGVLCGLTVLPARWRKTPDQLQEAA